TNEGNVQIEITPEIEFDYRGKFKGSKLLDALGNFLRKHILKYKIKDYWYAKIVGEAEDLSSTIKKSLGSEI
ncbi:hypothetical protein D6825_03620, partial [Candidatus Woesearchaeota archaeon]